MSEQAKKLAQALRSLSTGVDAYRTVADAAAELDRLADLTEKQAVSLANQQRTIDAILSQIDQYLSSHEQVNALHGQDMDRLTVAEKKVAALEADRDSWKRISTTNHETATKAMEEVDRLREECRKGKNELAAAFAHAADLVEQRGKLREEVSWHDQVRKDRDAARQELATLREDRDALAEGVRAYRLFYERCESASGASILRAQETVRAWERQHGHRADKKQEPARKADEVKPGTFTINNNTPHSAHVRVTFDGQDLGPFAIPRADSITLPTAGTYAITTDGKTATLKVSGPTTVKVEEKPALLDLRTLPVGTVCEAVEELDTIIRQHKIVGRFTITQHDTSAETDFTTCIQSESSELPVAWVKALQPARVISTPKPAPAPEPYRAGLPALALRRAHAEWIDEDGDVAHWSADGLRFRWTLVCGIDYRKGFLDFPAVELGVKSIRPHAATWAEVETKAAKLLGSEDKNAHTRPRCPEAVCMDWLRDLIGITDPTRDMTALWAAFREGQKS